MTPLRPSNALTRPATPRQKGTFRAQGALMATGCVSSGANSLIMAVCDKAAWLLRALDSIADPLQFPHGAVVCKLRYADTHSEVLYAVVLQIESLLMILQLLKEWDCPL